MSGAARGGTRCGWPGSGTTCTTATWCRCTSSSCATADGGGRVDSAVADARALDLAGRVGRRRAAARAAVPPAADEPTGCRRWPRPGGWAGPAPSWWPRSISRWAPRLHGVLTQQLYREHPQIRELVDVAETDGLLPPLFPGSFTGNTHRPDDLREEVAAAGLVVEDLVGVEGMAFAVADLGERLADPVDREVVLEAARAVQRVPELLGLGPHLLAVARVP